MSFFWPIAAGATLFSLLSSGKDEGEEAQSELTDVQKELAKLMLEQYKSRFANEEAYMPEALKTTFDYTKNTLNRPRNVVWGKGIFEPTLQPRKTYDIKTPDWNAFEPSDPSTELVPPGVVEPPAVKVEDPPGDGPVDPVGIEPDPPGDGPGGTKPVDPWTDGLANMEPLVKVPNFGGNPFDPFSDWLTWMRSMRGLTDPVESEVSPPFPNPFKKRGPEGQGLANIGKEQFKFFDSPLADRDMGQGLANADVTGLKVPTLSPQDAARLYSQQGQDITPPVTARPPTSTDSLSDLVIMYHGLCKPAAEIARLTGLSIPEVNAKLGIVAGPPISTPVRGNILGG